MKLFPLFLLFFASLSGLQPIFAKEPDALTYPSAPRGDTTDTYFDTKIADPYRDLENVDSPSTRKWIEAENKLTAELPGTDSGAATNKQTTYRALEL